MTTSGEDPDVRKAIAKEPECVGRRVARLSERRGINFGPHPSGVLRKRLQSLSFPKSAYILKYLEDDL
jgi:hypothetical protein